MSLKSLFLSSAAVLAAAFPARAETLAPVAEPDSEQYMRACDAFGSGYFYIPGTETCLRISGYIRSDTKGGDHPYARTYGDRQRSSYDWLLRATIRFHTASETDWGTLRSFMELRSDWQNGSEPETPNNNGSGALRFGYIELGGLRVGMDENIFSYWTGYYGNMINDDILNPAEKRTNAISYTFNTGGSFSAILGVEQGNSGGDNSVIADNPAYNGYRFRADGSKDYKKLSLQTHNWTPYVTGGLKYEQGWGSISTVFGYDSYDSEWAMKLRFDANLTNRFSLFLMGGYKSMDDYYNLDTTYGDNGARIIGHRADGSAIKRYGIYRQVNSMYGDWGGHGIVWLGGTYKWTKQTSFNFQNGYSGERTFETSANITQEIIDGLTLVCEVTYETWNDRYGRRMANGDQYRVSLKGQNAVQGAVRLQRSF